jgi:hypothetical protein
VRFTSARRSGQRADRGRDDKKLLWFQKQIANYELLIVDELGFVPLSKTGAELLSQRYERGSTVGTGNLLFQGMDRTPRLRTADRSPARPPHHHIHILEMNADSYRLKQRLPGASFHRRRLPRRPKRLFSCRESNGRVLYHGLSHLSVETKRRRTMPFSEQDVHEALKKHGVTTMNELARKIAEESASKSKSGIAEPDYLWSGKNYSLYHPEKTK